MFGTFIEILAGDHTDTIIARIEDAIVRGEPLHRILRLICLQSHVAVDGLRAKTLDHYSRLIVQSYGCSDALEWLLQLRRANLLHHSGTTVSRLSSSKFAFILDNFDSMLQMLTKRLVVTFFCIIIYLESNRYRLCTQWICTIVDTIVRKLDDQRCWLC